MDALTSLELEAQRRRETIAGDRDQELARFAVASETGQATILEPRAATRNTVPADKGGSARLVGPRLSIKPECEPAPLARQAAG